MYHKYDIALSFAGEDRSYVEQVATQLEQLGVKVFYDEFEQHNLWGKNLFVHLSDIYSKEAKYTIMFISKHYKKKKWTNLERESMQERAFNEAEEYILPVRFDDTKIPGLKETTGYIDLNKTSHQQLVKLIISKLKTSNNQQITAPRRYNSVKSHSDIEGLNIFMQYVPFCSLRMYMDDFPYTVDMGIFDVSYIFDIFQKSNPHIYPFSDEILQDKFSMFINMQLQVDSFINPLTTISDKIIYDTISDAKIKYLQHNFSEDEHKEIMEHTSWLKLEYIK
jgi:hypothetical protein